MNRAREFGVGARSALLSGAVASGRTGMGTCNVAACGALSVDLSAAASSEEFTRWEGVSFHAANGHGKQKPHMKCLWRWGTQDLPTCRAATADASARDGHGASAGDHGSAETAGPRPEG